MGTIRDPIQQGLAKPSVGDHLSPLGKGQVGRQDDGGLLRPLSDDLEQELRAKFCHRHVAYLIDSDQVITLPAGQHAAKLKLLLGLNQLVDQCGSRGEANSPLLAAGGDAQGR